MKHDVDSEQAIKSFLPPKGHILTAEGRVMKVLGDLAVTADECVVMPGAFVWIMPPHCDNPAGYGFHVLEMSESGYCFGYRGGKDTKWCNCYSTREAALAAAEGRA